MADLAIVKAPPSLDRGWVYFICNASGHIKIGYTSGDPHARLKKLQTGASDPLRLLYAVRVWDQSAETALHRHLREIGCHVQGEWFTPSRALAIIEYAKANHDCLCEVFKGIGGSNGWHCVDPETQSWWVRSCALVRGSM